MFRLFDGPLRNVKVTVPDVVGVQVKVDDLPAVTVKPGVVVGGFEVDPDCAATAASRHAMIESGAMRIMNYSLLLYSRDATELRREGKSTQKLNDRRWQERQCGSDI